MNHLKSFKLFESKESDKEHKIISKIRKAVSSKFEVADLKKDKFEAELKFKDVDGNKPRYAIKAEIQDIVGDTHKVTTKYKDDCLCVHIKVK